MKRLIKRILARLKPRERLYAVIYDSYDENAMEWKEEMYEMFSSPAEAVAFFYDAYGDYGHLIYNPRIVEIQESIPGPWNTTRDHPEFKK